MGGIIGGYRNHMGTAMGALLALAAMTYLYHPAYAADAAQVFHAVNQVPAGEVPDSSCIPWPSPSCCRLGSAGCCVRRC